MHRPIRKLQISNPQPYTPQRHDGPVPAALQPVVVPGLAPTRRPSTNEVPPAQGRQAEARGNGAGRFESAIPPPGVDYDGRSGDLRGAAVPPIAPGSGQGKPVRPARSTRRAPVSTAPSLQTSYQPESGPAERYQEPHDLSSPIGNEPPTPVNQPTGTSWNQDRTHRTELIDSQRDGRDPQRGERDRKVAVVDAFRTARGNGAQGTGGNVNPKRERATQGKDALLREGDSDDVDSVLRKIKRDWPEVLAPDFTPPTLALRLLATPHPTDLTSFLQIHNTLSASLASSVRSQYTVYAESLPLHAELVRALGEIQGVIRETKKGLRMGRELLAGGAAGMDRGAGAGRAGGASAVSGREGGRGGRGEMAGLWNRERVVRDTLKLLDTIESLNKVPERLESLIGDRKFLQASVILTRSLKTIDRDEMVEIEALNELRVYLHAQKTALMEIMVEELSSHLYLKTAYSETRWAVYEPGQTEMIVPKYNSDDPDGFSDPVPATPAEKMTNRLSKFLVSLSMKPMRDPILYLSDVELLELPAIPRARAAGGILGAGSDKQKTVNPEQDSFAYMEVILESLAVLGKLGNALEVVSARIGSELNALIETTIDEVAERMDMRRADFQSLRLQTIIEGSRSAPAAGMPRPGKPRLRNEALDQSDSADQAETLLDLFWTVYSKLRAVVEGHRVVSEIVGRIGMRPGQSLVQPAIAIPMEEVIKPMQKEVRTLMHDYLTDQDRGSDLNIKPMTSINDVLRDSKAARDRNKVIFRFGDTDFQALDKDLTPYQEQVDAAMKAYAPGLVALAEKGVQNGITVTSINLDLTSRKTRQYRLLVKPNPFNARILFQPYLSFVSSAKKVAGISSLDDEAEVIGSFMDDFVVKVYLPQLEEKVTGIFQAAVNSSGAFQSDISWETWSSHPIVKSVTDVMGLVNSLCFMLSHTPFQQENYSRLIIGIIVRYYQRCSTHYRDLVTSESYTAGDLPLAATWAQRDEIIALLEELQSTPIQDKDRRRELVRQETRIELSLNSGKSITEKDLIGGRAKIEAMCQLYYSIRWLVSQLNRLKVVAIDDTSPLAVKTAKRLSLIPTPGSITSPLLELSTAMAQRFDAILSTYDQLGDLVLFTLRVELRCRVMHYCEVSMSKGNYRIENEADEPDPYILDLTADLGECHGVMMSKLPEEDIRFLFCGLGSLADQIMVSTGRYVRFATRFGVYKIQRNILAIQQTLCNISEGTDDSILSKAQRYWQLYDLGPKAMLEELQNKKPEFSFDEYNHMLNLQCKVDPKASQRFSTGSENNVTGSVTTQPPIDADRTLYNDFLIDLHSLAINNWD